MFVINFYRKYKMGDSCILVIGGAGFVGSYLVIELIEVGYFVVVMDNFVNVSMGMLGWCLMYIICYNMYLFVFIKKIDKLNLKSLYFCCIIDILLFVKFFFLI